MRKLLWIGDAACPSGFAKATHGILDTIHKEWDVTVLGINYRGDPHSYPYPIYVAMAGGDPFGAGRLLWMLDNNKPDLIVIQQDPWNFPGYFRFLKKVPEYATIPVVGAVAVDGMNCVGDRMNDLTHAIFWTEFGQKEAIAGGYKGSSSVIPLAIKREDYQPFPRSLARRKLGIPPEYNDHFIVGNVNRNQPRKRLDLMIKYFAEWERQYQIPNAILFVHVAPTGDDGYDIHQLRKYYGVKTFLANEPETFYGVSEEVMRLTYCSFNVGANSGQGEGFGLPAFECLSCGIPYIGGDWSALGELLKGAAHLVPCTSTIATPGKINSIGGVPDQEAFIKGLHSIYSDETYRNELIQNGFALVQEERFTWSSVGKRWSEILDRVHRENRAAA